MQNGPLPSPEPTPIEALASWVVALLKLLFMRSHPLEVLYVLFSQRLCAIQDRIAEIAARFHAGTLPARRQRAQADPDAAASPRKPANDRNVNPFPREHGWFIKLFGEQITTDKGSLIDLIRTPEMQALMAASPEATALFRQVLNACGLLNEARPFLPQTCNRRARLQNSIARATNRQQSHLPDFGEALAGAEDQGEVSQPLDGFRSAWKWSSSLSSTRLFALESMQHFGQRESDPPDPSGPLPQPTPTDANPLASQSPRGRPRPPRRRTRKTINPRPATHVNFVTISYRSAESAIIRPAGPRSAGCDFGRR